VVITGRLPAGRSALVKIYRWKRRARRFSRRPAYRVLVTASRSGRFRRRIRRRALRHGKWLVVVQAANPRVLPARARLR
jgi:hypothetical protein